MTDFPQHVADLSKDNTDLPENRTEKIPVGISSCLLGERERYDGGHKKSSYIMDTLGEYFDYRAFCPEMEIGLGVPRETIRLVQQDDTVRVVGSKNPDLDVTDALVASAHQQRDWHQKLFAYIVKKDSPSCGMERVKVFKKDTPHRIGSGFYTKTLMENFPNLPIEEEGRLGDSVLRENFIHRVFIYRRWHELIDSGLTLNKLTDFHARHKLVLFSHNQDAARTLGNSLSNAHKLDLEQYAYSYISALMAILKIPATRRNHVNVLQHIQGYLKQYLDKDDKQELVESIERYRVGQLPLIVPITLLNHYFRKFPNEYIDRSYYLAPHPKELMLLNAL